MCRLSILRCTKCNVPKESGESLLRKKSIEDVPAAIIPARGRAAIDALKLMKLKSNEKNTTQSGPEDHLLLNYKYIISTLCNLLL